MPTPRAIPRIVCSSNRGVEHPSSPKTAAQSARHAVHPSLRGHVLAEDEHLGMTAHQLGQRGIDRLRQREGGAGLGSRLSAGRVTERRDPTPAITRRRRRQCQRRQSHRRRWTGGEAHPKDRSKPRPSPGPEKPCSYHSRTWSAVAWPGPRARTARRAEQRVPVVVLHDRATASVRGLDVRARVTHQADGVEVQHGRPAGPPDQIDHHVRLLEQALGVGTVGAHTRDARQSARARPRATPSGGRADPGSGCPHR